MTAKTKLMGHNDTLAKPTAPPPGFDRWRRHVAEMLRLAPVIVLARSGMFLVILVDTVMVGRYSAVELGYMSMGMSLVQPLVVTSIGLIMGTLVLSANAFGAERFEECGRVWRRSMVYAAGLGTIAAAIAMFGETLLTWTGQSPELAREGGKVMAVLGLGLPAHLLFLASSFFLEGIRRPAPGFIAMGAANVVNLGLNWLFIYGAVEMVPGGALGAALATTLARWVVAGAMVIYILTMRDQERFGVRRRAVGGWGAWANQRRLGYATGISLAVESGAFTAVQQFVGWLGPVPLAAFTAAFYLQIVSFMVAIGFGAATAVRVGNAHGRGDPVDMARAGWTGLALNTCAMVLVGTALVSFDETFVAAFTRDPAVAALAVPLLFWVAMVLLSDGAQAVLANALRGRQDVWTACYLQTFAFFVVMVPLAWVLVFPMGHGVVGVFQAVGIATLVSTALLATRFFILYRRDVKSTG